ncbi:MAG: hypothetical protein KDA57_10955 [Planctomycetales bacterium]|nr:hypothetical protein [Planctomycetales bacterium]
MSQFSILIEEVADQQGHSLSDVLMKAKVLASRLRSRKFRQWVDAEINGYGNGQELPEYRVVGTTIEGSFGGYFGSYQTGVPMSTGHLDGGLREAFTTLKIPNGVAYVEDLVSGESGDMGMWMDGAAVNYLRENGTQISDMILNRVFKRVSNHSLAALLSSVRSRLLDFLLELRERYPELENSDQAANEISVTEVDEAVERRVYQNCTVIEGSEMRDNFQAGQAGAMGPNAEAENMSFVQVLREGIGDNSLADLASDLEKLREVLLSESKSADQDAAVAAIAEAEEAARKGDAKTVLGSLKAAGKLAFDTATKIGTAVAAKAIAKSMGL